MEIDEGDVKRLIALAETGINNLSKRLDAVSAKLNTIKANIEGLDALPSIEKNLTERIDRLEANMEKGLRAIGRQLDQLAGDIVRVRADQTDFDDRLSNLESKAS